MGAKLLRVQNIPSDCEGGRGGFVELGTAKTLAARWGPCPPTGEYMCQTVILNAHFDLRDPRYPDRSLCYRNLSGKGLTIAIETQQI